MFLKRFFTPTPLTDQKVIESIQSDSEVVLISLYERNFRALGAFFKKFNAGSRQMSEVISKTVILFWKEFQHFNETQAPEVDKIIQHTARSYWIRKKQLENEFPEMVNNDYDLMLPLEDPDDIHLKKKLKLLSGHLRMLSETGKKVLYYTYYEKLKDEKIAEILNLEGVEEVNKIRNKLMNKYRKVLVGNYIKRDLI